MAKGIHDLGIRELESFQRRVRRQQTLDRIWPDDAKHLLEVTDKLLEYIRTMHEDDKDDREF